MKKTVFAVFCLTASMASAQDVVETNAEDDDKVDLYVSVIENIDVTAEKKPAKSAEVLDADIDAILNEADLLEDDEL